MKLSVIVPVYNTGKYLRQCAESILSQSFGDFEVIFINDGSTDDSGRICREYAAKDNRVRLITQANLGQSRARNAGIGVAEGEYISFVDSDDFLEADCFEKAMNAAAGYGADCICFGYKRLYRDGKTKSFCDFSKETYFSGRNEINRLLSSMVACHYKDVNPFTQIACCKIYKTDIFRNNNILFKSVKDIFSEDFLLNFEFFSKCKSAACLPYAGYIYRQTAGSTSESYQNGKHIRAGNLFQTVSSYPAIKLIPNGEKALAANVMGLISVSVKQLVTIGGPGTVGRIREIMDEPRLSYAASICEIRKIRFPLSFFCFLTKHKMAFTMFATVKLFILIKSEKK